MEPVETKSGAGLVGKVVWVRRVEYTHDLHQLGMLWFLGGVEGHLGCGKV